MAEHWLSEADSERILQLDKWIEEKFTWRRDDNGNWYVRVPVACIEQQMLEWYARFNPRTGNFTSILFWQKQTNLRRLDVGKLHPNPDGSRVGRVHKHRLSDVHGNQLAYEPPEMSLQDDLVTTLRKFLTECNIECRVDLIAPPSSFQRSSGL